MKKTPQIKSFRYQDVFAELRSVLVAAMPEREARNTQAALGRAVHKTTLRLIAGDDPCAHDSFVDIDLDTGLKQCYRCGRGFYEPTSTGLAGDRA